MSVWYSSHQIRPDLGFIWVIMKRIPDLGFICDFVTDGHNSGVLAPKFGGYNSDGHEKMHRRLTPRGPQSQIWDPDGILRGPIWDPRSGVWDQAPPDGAIPDDPHLVLICYQMAIQKPYQIPDSGIPR